MPLVRFTRTRIVKAHRLQVSAYPSGYLMASTGTSSPDVQVNVVVGLIVDDVNLLTIKDATRVSMLHSAER